ncbi:hypothetical protein D3C73_1052380 [compost metagenome]
MIERNTNITWLRGVVVADIGKTMDWKWRIHHLGITDHNDLLKAREGARNVCGLTDDIVAPAVVKIVTGYYKQLRRNLAEAVDHSSVPKLWRTR